jgi:cytochrome c peroxidase
LGAELSTVVERLRADATYRRQFGDVFGRPPDTSALSYALATYVRTILAGASDYDRFEAGDATALSPEAQLGLRLFRGRAHCTRCHSGSNFTDEDFHNTGVSWGRRPYDAGRAVVTGVPEDTGKFKTPTLREIERTAPYMHDGTIATLEKVVKFYDRGGKDNPFRDQELRPLRLTEDEKTALVAFLRSLSGTVSDGG